jgi:subfamily B ATP-binding cassette protein HlyB/CyaB
MDDSIAIAPVNAQQQNSVPETAPPFDTGLHSLVVIARFHDIAVDPVQLQHEFNRKRHLFDTPALIRAAKQIGLKTRSTRVTFNRLNKINLPAIAKDTDGEYFIIGKADDEKVLIQYPHNPQVKVISREALESRWDGEILLFTRRKLKAGEASKFDFTWFIPVIVKYRKFLAEVLLASFFIQIFALVTPLFFQVIIDKVLVHKGFTTLDVLAFGLVIVSVFEVLLSGLRTYLLSHTTNKMDVILGAQLFKHLLALPISYFESRRVGDSVARVRELENIRNFLTGSSITVVIDLLFTVVFLAVMYYYSPTLSWIVLGSIPVYLLLSILVTPILRVRLNDKFTRGAENQAFLVESINGIETVKSMAIEPQLQNRWGEQLAGYVSASFRASNLGNISSQIAGLINKIVMVMTLWFGANLVISGELSVGQLIAFNMLSARVSGPILRLVQLWQDFQQAGISMQRLGDILNMPAENNLQQNKLTLPHIKGDIGFDNVNFRYRPDGPLIIKQLNLNMAAGEIVGIVGKSGSGKSTLAKLIQRLYTPENGRVIIDGIDLSVVSGSWLRRQIGVVMQENFLFNRSIRENIALNEPGISIEHVIQAAKLAGAHDFILELQEGYDTLVGEHGANLSGGQRQRIAIARALISDPGILIFDEATSALDYESEQVIQRNMKSICKNRTVIIIAHRLSTIRDCDRIIVMDKGVIAEQGTHQLLLNKAGLYSRLHKIQTGVSE